MLPASELALLGRSPMALRILATMAASRCSPFEAIARCLPASGIEHVLDIPYGAAPRQALDIYRQPQAHDAPVVILLYGGGWRQGDRQGYRFLGETFASSGYVTVIPDYRLYPAVRFPAFVEDAASALAWVRRNIGQHGGDPSRICVIGHSAGAHIGALLALDGRYAAAAGLPENPVRAFVGLAGPYAFEPLKYESTRAIFKTAADPDDARPIAHVGPAAPPMLLLHGELDGTVWPINSEKLAHALCEAGCDARHVIYPRLGHITIMLALATAFRTLAPVQSDVLAFLAATSGPAAAAEGAASA